jgi:hypothetical protein
MRAAVGDQLVIKSHAANEPDRRAEVLEVRDADGHPPWIVRWSDGTEAEFTPTEDTLVEHYTEDPGIEPDGLRADAG